MKSFTHVVPNLDDLLVYTKGECICSFRTRKTLETVKSNNNNNFEKSNIDLDIKWCFRINKKCNAWRKLAGIMLLRKSAVRI